MFLIIVISISHVLSLRTRTAFASYCQVVIIYLREEILPVPPSVHFLQGGAPTIIWVSHSWGLPRSTFTVSSEATSLWHFSGSVDHIASCDLGLPSAVKAARALPYLIFSVSTNTTVISEPCEHGLSSTNIERLQRLLEITMTI